MAIRLFLFSFECRAAPFNGRNKGIKINEEGCQMGGGWQGGGCSGARGQEMEHKDLEQSWGKLLRGLWKEKFLPARAALLLTQGMTGNMGLKWPSLQG